MQTNVAAIIIFSCVFISSSRSVMLGGPTDQDVNSSEYQDMAWKAMKELNSQDSNNGSQYYYVPIKVAKVQTQVVAGSLTTLEVYVGESSCKKSDVQAENVTKANCQLRDGGNKALYKVEVWEKPWENFEQIDVEKIRDVGASESI